MNTRIVGLIAVLFLPQQFGQSDSWDNLSQLTMGQRIEVVDMQLKSVRGDFTSYAEDLISLRVGEDNVSIPRSDVFRVTDQEQSHRLRNVLLGLALGGAAGAGAGALITSAVADSSEVGYGASTGLLVGMAGGAALGAILPSSVTLYRAAPEVSSRQP